MSEIFRPAVTALLYLAFLLLLAACADEPAAILRAPGVHNDTTYLCDNARQFTAHFDENGEKVTVLYNGESRTLWRAMPDPVFTDGFYSLYIAENGTLRLNRYDVPILGGCVPFPNL